jgi:small basic protein (TIGR04137 family)
MSQHPSLKSTTKGKAHRSVWKRFERLKFLVEKDKWVGGNSIFGLPKMKLLKLKIKKEKAEPVAEGVGAEGAPVAEGAAPAEGKGAAAPAEGGAAKAAPGKESAKETAKGGKKAEKPGKK